MKNNKLIWKIDFNNHHSIITQINEHTFEFNCDVRFGNDDLSYLNNLSTETSFDMTNRMGVLYCDDDVLETDCTLKNANEIIMMYMKAN